MINLTKDEARVIGVLVEKALTTPGQYPLTLNSLVSGCNQRSNRLPILNLDENRVIAALDSLKAKDLAREVMLASSRVTKFRHTTKETLEISISELVVLAELLLRGPQTLGEIRGRASRMHPLESLEVVQSILDHLSNRDQPMVRDVAPAPGSRAKRFAQLLCPDAHPIEAASSASSSTSPTTAAHNNSELEKRIETLERELKELRSAINTITQSLGAH
ncbi:MAG: DUF480 domain-containing protein [Planctomycetes bacterium]|nr:DUF480 domain-containing protein [Planctomycetota bacterium]